MPAPQDFASQIAPEVISRCVNTGVFPSVVIAQGIEESGSGSSKQARLFNNIFGHMASALYEGKKGQTVPGGKWWRIYDSVADCIASHIDILKRPLYRLAGAFKAKTPYDQALALQQAGYNKGPDRLKYAAKLYSIIRSAGLEQYDKQMFAMERQINKNGLAYHEQPEITQVVRNLFG